MYIHIYFSLCAYKVLFISSLALLSVICFLVCVCVCMQSVLLHFCKLINKTCCRYAYPQVKKKRENNAFNTQVNL